MADLTKTQAEVAELQARTRNQLALALYHERQARMIGIKLKDAEDEHGETKASDWEARVYRFTSYVDEESTQECMRTLATWARLDPDAEFEIVFTSLGGDSLHGYALFDFIRMTSRAGNRITTTDLGHSASMAGILLQAGDVRRIGKESYIHLHEVAWETPQFKFSEHEDEVAFGQKLIDQMIRIYIERANGKITEKKLRDLVMRKEAWFTSTEAWRYGFVDEIV